MSMQEDFPEQSKPKAGTSTGVKVLLVLAGIGGVMCLVCCGGGAFIYFKYIKGAFSQDPTVVQATTREITPIEIPAQFAPTGSMNFGGMKMAVYQDAADQGMLMLMEMGRQMAGGDPEQQRDAMLAQMQLQSGMGNNTQFQIEERKTRNYTINGKKAQFVFAKGKGQNGRAMRQVFGSFTTATSAAVLMLMTSEEKYDEAAIEAMIASLGAVPAPDDPADAAPADTTPGGEAPQQNAPGFGLEPDGTKPELEVEQPEPQQ